MTARRWIVVALAALASFAPARARAEKPSSPDATRTVGMGFTGTGIALVGAGGYFLYKGAADHNAPTTKLGLALAAGGAITTSIGVVMFLSTTTQPEQPPAPRHALVVGPSAVRYVAEF